MRQPTSKPSCGAMPPQFRLSPLYSAIALAILGLPARAQVSAVANGQWDQAVTWSNGAPATTGNAYVIGSGFLVTTPPTAGGASTIPFNGDSLTVQSGGALQLLSNSGAQSSTPSFSIPGLVLDGGGTLSLYGTAIGNSILPSADCTRTL